MPVAVRQRIMDMPQVQSSAATGSTGDMENSWSVELMRSWLEDVAAEQAWLVPGEHLMVFCAVGSISWEIIVDFYNRCSNLTEQIKTDRTS